MEERLNPSSEMQEYPYDFDRLQNDIISVFLSGKPLIKDPREFLRKPFKFLVRRPHSLTLGVTEIDIELLSEYMKQTPGFNVIVVFCSFSVCACRYEVHVLVCASKPWNDAMYVCVCVCVHACTCACVHVCACVRT